MPPRRERQEPRLELREPGPLQPKPLGFTELLGRKIASARSSPTTAASWKSVRRELEMLVRRKTKARARTRRCPRKANSTMPALGPRGPSSKASPGGFDHKLVGDSADTGRQNSCESSFR